MKVQASYQLRKGYCMIIDEVPEEILRNSYSNREVKEQYLRHIGRCIADIKNFQLIYPTELEYEED